MLLKEKKLFWHKLHLWARVRPFMSLLEFDQFRLLAKSNHNRWIKFKLINLIIKKDWKLLHNSNGTLWILCLGLTWRRWKWWGWWFKPKVLGLICSHQFGLTCLRQFTSTRCKLVYWRIPLRYFEIFDLTYILTLNASINESMIFDTNLSHKSISIL